ncbi:MAG: bifunctional methylenetetrahydrofolate dehydrogenase/methenyltetrahydrofolate cyclohydrolase FolD [Ruminococcus sp.]|nr:bifunctional methylenetetrahydrofolate dehydrogenase/methenyltetrahydrofolate cyclohydrolase FolD [Ruminococcus sp.]
MGKIIDGKAVSAQVKERIKAETAKLKEQGIEVGLAVVIVGEDPASKVYVRNKKKACEEVGFTSYEYALPEETTEEELLELVNKLNADDKVNGILVQLPLPKHLDDKVIINNILPEKDVDAFHPVNVGKIMIGDYSFLPCTPAGVMELIASTGTEIQGKECVVIGRSNIVGKPQAMLLLHQSGTVTICHSKTKNLKEVASRADILVSAIGKPKIINSEYIKEGAVVIDVGMNRDENGKLCGDIDFEECKDKAGYITPVPGGVGPMTIAMLMQNTLTAAKIKNGILPGSDGSDQVKDTKDRTVWNKLFLHT